MGHCHPCTLELEPIMKALSAQVRRGSGMSQTRCSGLLAPATTCVESEHAIKQVMVKMLTKAICRAKVGKCASPGGLANVKTCPLTRPEAERKLLNFRDNLTNLHPQLPCTRRQGAPEDCRQPDQGPEAGDDQVGHQRSRVRRHPRTTTSSHCGEPTVHTSSRRSPTRRYSSQNASGKHRTAAGSDCGSRHVDRLGSCVGRQQRRWEPGSQQGCRSVDRAGCGEE